MRIKAQRRKALGFCIAECVPVGEKGPASGGGVRGGGSGAVFRQTGSLFPHFMIY